MFEYFRVYYVEKRFGPSYMLTTLLILIGILLIVQQYSLTKKGILAFVRDVLVCWGLFGILACIYYRIFGMSQLDVVVLIITMIAVLFVMKRYEMLLRMVREVVYFACYFQIIAISEPVGILLKSIFGEDKLWLEHSTWVIVLLFLGLTVFLINLWSVESMTYVPRQATALVILFAGIGVVLQATARALDISRGYKVIVAVAFYLMQLVSYYLFYLISLESKKNMEYMALAHKEQLDRELVQATKENMENLHLVRHEIKNHMAYIRVLVASEEYDKLFEYTNKVLGENEQYIQKVDCGNQVVDAVVSHSILAAARQNVELRTRIVVPQELPFEETDFCSILSNLINNAIEAAAASGQEKAKVSLDILPKQDYLFIHITNPVGKQVPRSRRLSLATTKKDKKVHGYGTKVIAHLVEKYRGSVEYDMKEDEFIVNVMLDMGEEI